MFRPFSIFPKDSATRSSYLKTNNQMLIYMPARERLNGAANDPGSPVMNPHLATLAHNIRSRRASLNLSQQRLSDRCKLHRTYICDIEKGRRNVSLDALVRLAEGLETTVSELTVNVGRKSEA
jgi:DNA-binding XRE family transcriptional regulator